MARKPGFISKLNKYAKKRVKELKDLATTDLTIDKVETNFAGQKLAFKVNVERAAAWKLYIEIETRIATQELKATDG